VISSHFYECKYIGIINITLLFYRMLLIQKRYNFRIVYYYLFQNPDTGCKFSEMCPVSPHDACYAISVKTEEVSDLKEEEDLAPIPFPGIKAEPEVSHVSVSILSGYPSFYKHFIGYEPKKVRNAVSLSRGQETIGKVRGGQCYENVNSLDNELLCLISSAI
jgi:hypothetical protein